MDVLFLPVMSPDVFSGRFVPLDVLSPDVLSGHQGFVPEYNLLFLGHLGFFWAGIFFIFFLNMYLFTASTTVKGEHIIF